MYLRCSNVAIALTDRASAQQADVSTLPLKILGKAAVVRGILVGSRTQYVPDTCPSGAMLTGLV